MGAIVLHRSGFICSTRIMCRTVMKIRKRCVTRIAKWLKSVHRSTKVAWIGLKLYRIIEDEILSTFMGKTKSVILMIFIDLFGTPQFVNPPKDHFSLVWSHIHAYIHVCARK